MSIELYFVGLNEIRDLEKVGGFTSNSRTSITLLLKKNSANNKWNPDHNDHKCVHYRILVKSAPSFSPLLIIFFVKINFKYIYFSL